MGVARMLWRCVMARLESYFLLVTAVSFLSHGCSSSDLLPMVINTWPFIDANLEAKAVLEAGGSVLDAIEKGCSRCEAEQCDGSVGYGGSPDENGETTLDAMIMDGETHDVGSVGCLRRVKSAISVARAVMEYTGQTLLVGDQATEFALQMGFKNESLTTNKSREMWTKWHDNHCQPNFWNKGTVEPDPTSTCGPYHPAHSSRPVIREADALRSIRGKGHDTIGMVAIDANGKIACGTTTNGLNHKIPGRVGDSPITGAGCYVEKGVGGAAATGDGDIMMRFLPSYRVVQSMKQGMSPRDAIVEALGHISEYYTYTGAMIAVNINGEYGAMIAANINGEYAGAHVGRDFDGYKFTVYNPKLKNSTIIKPN